MSAFMQSKTHIAAMVGSIYGHAGQGDRTFSWYGSFGPGSGERDIDPETMAAELIKENRASVGARYNDTPEAVDVPTRDEIARWKDNPLTVAETIKAIKGYEYQACEHDEWHTSKACQLCNDAIHMLIRRIPGYDSAETWAIGDDVQPKGNAISIFDLATKASAKRSR